MELTKLQRIGISHLMLEIKKHNPFLNNGRLIFVNNRNGEFTNMFIRENKTNFEFMITLSKEELINDNIQYEYLYDSLNDFFRIIAVEEKTKINGIC